MRGSISEVNGGGRVALADRNGVTEDNSERGGPRMVGGGEERREWGGDKKKQRKTSARKPERSLRRDGM